MLNENIEDVILEADHLEEGFTGGIANVAKGVGNAIAGAAKQAWNNVKQGAQQVANNVQTAYQNGSNQQDMNKMNDKNLKQAMQQAQKLLKMNVDKSNEQTLNQYTQNCQNVINQLQQAGANNPDAQNLMNQLQQAIGGGDNNNEVTDTTGKAETTGGNPATDGASATEGAGDTGSTGGTNTTEGTGATDAASGGANTQQQQKAGSQRLQGIMNVLKQNNVAVTPELQKAIQQVLTASGKKGYKAGRDPKAYAEALILKGHLLREGFEEGFIDSMIADAYDGEMEEEFASVDELHDQFVDEAYNIYDTYNINNPEYEGDDVVAEYESKLDELSDSYYERLELIGEDPELVYGWAETDCPHDN